MVGVKLIRKMTKYIDKDGDGCDGDPEEKIVNLLIT